MSRLISRAIGERPAARLRAWSDWTTALTVLGFLAWAALALR